MKKLLSIFLVFALLFTLASCAGKKDGDQNHVIDNPNKNEENIIDFGSVPLTIETEEESPKGDSPSQTKEPEGGSSDGSSGSSSGSAGSEGSGSNSNQGGSNSNQGGSNSNQGDSNSNQGSSTPDQGSSGEGDSDKDENLLPGFQTPVETPIIPL